MGTIKKIGRGLALSIIIDLGHYQDIRGIDPLLGDGRTHP